VSFVDSNGRTIWIVDAHGYGKRFVVRADEKLIAFLEIGIGGESGLIQRRELGLVSFERPPEIRSAKKEAS